MLRLTKINKPTTCPTACSLLVTVDKIQVLTVTRVSLPPSPALSASLYSGHISDKVTAKAVSRQVAGVNVDSTLLLSVSQLLFPRRAPFCNAHSAFADVSPTQCLQRTSQMAGTPWNTPAEQEWSWQMHRRLQTQPFKTMCSEQHSCSLLRCPVRLFVGIFSTQKKRKQQKNKTEQNSERVQRLFLTRDLTGGCGNGKGLT